MRLRTAAVLLVLSLSSGCKKETLTLEQTFEQLELAIVKGDAAAFYRHLDGPTQAAVKDTLASEKLQRTIVAGKFPESERAAALERLGAAAEDDPARYFARINERDKVVEALRKRLGSVSGEIMKKPESETSVWVARKDGLPFRFARGENGRWGFSELQVEWNLAKDRAAHAVKTVRENAALYEKAGN